jgi:hypothetical protein
VAPAVELDTVHVGLVSVAAAAGVACPAIPPAAASTKSKSSRTAVEARRRMVEYCMAGRHPLVFAAGEIPWRRHLAPPGHHQGPEMISIVIVDVYEPDEALAGTLTHQPTGFACALPPMTIWPRPVAAAVS